MQRRLVMHAVLKFLVCLCCCCAAWACTCWELPVTCERDIADGIVFAGEVISITPIQPAPNREFYETERVLLRVTEAFNGVHAETVAIRTSRGCCDCSVHFDIGKSYLVWAARSAVDGDLRTGGCVGTTTIDHVSADLDYLRRWKAGTATPRIFGVVAETILGYRSLRADKGPIPGAIITARSGGRSWQVTTGDDGRYDLDNLPSGKFEVTAQIPQLGTIRETAAFDLRPMACAEKNFRAPVGGRIAGRLLGTDGKPVAGKRMTARIPGNHTMQGRRFSGPTTADGEFSIVGLTGNEYVLLLHDSVHEKAAGRESYVQPEPPVYYPGVVDMAEATVFRFSQARVHENLTFRLPSLGNKIEFTGTIVHPDGTAGSGAVAMLVDKRAPGSVAEDIAVDGTFRLKGYPGRSYWITGYLRKNGILMHAEPVAVSAEAREPVRLIVNEKGHSLECKTVTEGWSRQP